MYNSDGINQLDSSPTHCVSPLKSCHLKLVIMSTVVPESESEKNPEMSYSKWLHLYTVALFMVFAAHSSIHAHTPTPRWPDNQEAFGVQCLVQGHLWT